MTPLAALNLPAPTSRWQRLKRFAARAWRACKVAGRFGITFVVAVVGVVFMVFWMLLQLFIFIFSAMAHASEQAVTEEEQ